MDELLFEMISNSKKEELAVILSCNEHSSQFGLSLTAPEAKALALCRNESLRTHRRIEFGAGILDQLIETFCDSQYLYQQNYLETLMNLQDIFYQFKNECQDMVTDSELLHFMKEQFEEVCMGDVQYLADTCLERFAAAVRSGYTGYQATQGYGEYDRLSSEKRWDKDLYLQTLKELCWE